MLDALSRNRLRDVARPKRGDLNKQNYLLEQVIEDLHKKYPEKFHDHASVHSRVFYNKPYNPVLTPYNHAINI
jgi:hypothetical protein